MTPRRRIIHAGCNAYVVTRGNAGKAVFKTRNDYRMFVDALVRTADRFGMPLIAACLLPDQVHLIVRPVRAADLSRFMQALLASYTRLYRERHGGYGALWQNGYAYAPVMDGVHTRILRDRLYNLPRKLGLVRASPDWRHMYGCDAFAVPARYRSILRFVTYGMTLMIPLGDPEWLEALPGYVPPAPPKPRGRPPTKTLHCRFSKSDGDSTG